jgi:3-methylcrotonyl-CoA carboxylase alpha subunit
VDTGLIARAGAALAAEPQAEAADWALAALGALGLAAPARGAAPWDARDGWRAWGAATAHAAFTEGAARLTREGAGWRAETPAGAVALAVAPSADGALAVSDGARRFAARVALDGRAATVLRAGRARRFEAVDPLAIAAEDGAAGDHARAPLPGVVKAVHVAPGDAVTAGDRLVTIEAMKMEHALRAGRDGVVAEVGVAEGDQVEEGALLAALAPV